MSRHKNIYEPYPDPKNGQLGSKKKNDTKIKSELKELQKIKVVQLHEQTTKQLSNPTPTPKPTLQGPKETKMTPKLSQIKMSEFRESQKMKVVQLHELKPKRF